MPTLNWPLDDEGITLKLWDLEWSNSFQGLADYLPVVPSSVKCRYCTRLIEFRGGKWQRVHPSKSEPGRPDHRCMRGKDYGPDGYALHEPLSSLPGKPLPELLDLGDPWSVCRWCNMGITFDGTLWRDGSGPKISALCTGDGPDIYHRPLEPCPYCLAPASDCAHWAQGGKKMGISHSQWDRKRWLVPGCCLRCWSADLLGDLEDHCQGCPCCDTEGLSRFWWADKMGNKYRSPLEVARYGPACPFPYSGIPKSQPA